MTTDVAGYRVRLRAGSYVDTPQTGRYSNLLRVLADLLA